MKIKYLFPILFCLISIINIEAERFVSIRPYTISDDNNESIIIPANKDNLIKRLPVYEFNDSVVGLFMQRFVTTMSEMHLTSMTKLSSLDDIVSIRSTDDVRYNYKKLPLHCILVDYVSWSEDIIKKSVGIIRLPNHKYGIIYSDSEEWCRLLNLSRTDNTIEIYYGKSYIPNLEKDEFFMNEWTTSYYYWAVLKIIDNKKVDPLMIYNINLPIQTDEEMNAKFNWIEDFYKKHDLPAGCGYYDQKIIH